MLLTITHVLSILAGFALSWFIKNPQSGALAAAATETAEEVAEAIQPALQTTSAPEPSAAVSNPQTVSNPPAQN